MTKFAYPSRWPIEHPERLQLYAFATPNGRKISVALEELELPYEVHRVDITRGDQNDEGYRRLNPNGKIPVLVDPNGPGGEPLALMESGAILLYLAEKTGKLIPHDEALRWQTIQWLFFQMASVGPMFGQLGHFFKFARDKTSDTYALERYTAETHRLLGVLEQRLTGRPFLVGETLTIADVATFPWVVGLDFYGAKQQVRYHEFPQVDAWLQRCLARPAAQRGMQLLQAPAR